MRNITIALHKIPAIILVMMASAITASAQADATPKLNESSVWYNARHGDGAAMNQIGVWYFNGSKVNKDYQQAYYWWSRGAMQQNPKAIANLGVCYQYGRGVERDSIAAIRLYLTAIESGQQELFDQRLSNAQNSIFDSMLIGLCYERGIGVRHDLKGAATMYARAADRGSVDGMAAAGRAYQAYGDTANALKYLDKSAAAGDVESGYLAAKIRLDSAPSSPGANHAADLILSAAQAGIPAAEADLGKMYLEGKGVAADKAKAMEWLRTAAQDGNAAAMWQYGQQLKAAKSYDEALFWLSKSAAAGMQDALTQYINALPDKDGFKHYVRGMKAYLIDKDYATAIAEFQSAGKSNQDDGKVMEMMVLADDHNPKSNRAKATKTLNGMTDDNPLAAYVLASIYLCGKGGQHDNTEALSLLRQASNAGNPNAQDALATIYFDGHITSADRRQAIALYTKAYQQRRLSPSGANRLEMAYTTGSYGLPIDMDKAATFRHYNTDNPVLEALKQMR